MGRCRPPALDIGVALRRQGRLVKLGAFRGPLRIGQRARHLRARIGGLQCVELAAGIQRLELFAHLFDIFRNANSKELAPEHRYDLDTTEIAEVWRRGSVVASWLLDLLAISLSESPDLHEFTGFVEDSGEGRWTVMAAIEEAVPCDVLSSSLYTRFRSRQGHTFAEKIISAMRKGFGGHVEPKVGKG